MLSPDVPTFTPICPTPLLDVFRSLWRQSWWWAQWLV
jgi:hypothetical protein